MPEKNYMQDQDVRGYYDRWRKSPTLLDHPNDIEKFYKFVKKCVSFAGHKDTRKKLDTSILRLHLYDDLHGKYSEDYYDKITHEIIVLFEHLLEYEDTTLP